MSPTDFARATVYLVWWPNGHVYRDGDGNTRFNHRQATELVKVTHGRMSPVVK